MAAIQLSFSLRTSSNVKTVHLIGSWDGYQGQLPLSKGSKSGSWTGTFRFQSSVLKQGQRYWYYYMMDGYHVSHDPAQEHTVEPTTGRKLNILDVPAGKTSAPAPSASKRASRRYSRDVPRGVAACDIQSPRPQRPGQTKAVIEAQFQQATLEQLASRLQLDDDSEEESDDDSDVDSDCPSLSSGSSRSSCSSPSSVSSVSSSCSCERYGITRNGQRVKLDCGGARCGFSDEECSSEDEAEEYQAKVRATRRHAVLIRN
jgi:hypothetical protein